MPPTWPHTGPSSNRHSGWRSRGGRSSARPHGRKGPCSCRRSACSRPDVRGMGHNSARYIHVVTEALKLAFADRERFYGMRRRRSPSCFPRLCAGASRPDPDGSRDARRAAARRSAPQRRRTGREPDGGGPRRPPAAAAAAPDGTTHIAVIDGHGNMIGLTPSGGVFRKSAFAPELGCTLSTRSEMFVLEDGHPNALAPGKRPRTTLVSYLISEGGVPTMTVGCPGGTTRPRLICRSSSTWSSSGMNPQQAVEAPRFSTQTLVNSFYPRVYRPGQLNVEPGIPESTRAELRRLGHMVTEIGACGVGAVVTRRTRRPACSRPAPIRAVRPTRSPGRARGAGGDRAGQAPATSPPWRGIARWPGRSLGTGRGWS